MRLVHVCKNMRVHTCTPVTEWINVHTGRDAKRQRYTPVTLKVILRTS